MTEMYFVQSFRQRGKKLEPDQPEKMRSPEAAIARAERLVGLRAGTWAYSQNIDVETDTYDDPVALFRTGQLPDGVAN